MAALSHEPCQRPRPARRADSRETARPLPPGALRRLPPGRFGPAQPAGRRGLARRCGGARRDRTWPGSCWGIRQPAPGRPIASARIAHCPDRSRRPGYSGAGCRGGCVCAAALRGRHDGCRTPDAAVCRRAAVHAGSAAGPDRAIAGRSSHIDAERRGRDARSCCRPGWRRRAALPRHSCFGTLLQAGYRRSGRPGVGGPGAGHEDAGCSDARRRNAADGGRQGVAIVHRRDAKSAVRATSHDGTGRRGRTGRQPASAVDRDGTASGRPLAKRRAPAMEPGGSGGRRCRDHRTADRLGAGRFRGTGANTSGCCGSAPIVTER